MTWSFVFTAIGVPEDQNLGREPVSKGLQWWNREIRVLSNGTRMFLYSLMIEGGIPAKLLTTPGLFLNAVMGLVKEIELEGGTDLQQWLDLMAARRVHCFPQTFQTEDIARLFAELAFSLVELRNELPSDLPDESAVRWLDDHRMGWESRLPVRMTNQTAEFPIDPALRAERRIPSSLGRPLCRRELRCDDIGIWHAYLTVGDHGWLPARTFPGPEDVRLRPIPLKFDGLVYIATPEQEGFRLRRFNYTGEESRAFNLQDSFVLKAFADGRIKGETVIDAGLSPPDEVPGF